MIKGTILPEDITLGKIYTPNIGAPKYVKQILMDINGEIDSITATEVNFNTPLASINRSSRQRMNKKRAALNDTLDWVDFIDIFEAFLLKAAEYTFVSIVNGKFFRIDHVLRHQTILNNIRRLKSYQASSLTIMV